MTDLDRILFNEFNKNKLKIFKKMGEKLDAKEMAHALYTVSMRLMVDSVAKILFSMAESDQREGIEMACKDLMVNVPRAIKAIKHDWDKMQEKFKYH